MESTIADRIIELAMKWQNKVEWEIVYEQAANSRKFQDDARQERTAAKRTQEPGSEEMLRLFQQSAKQNVKDAKAAHEFVIEAHRELLELKNLLRRYAPTLFKLMPRFDFFAAIPADLEDKLQRVCEIEGAVRAQRQPTPDGDSPTRKEKLASHDKQIKLLCKTQTLNGQWAKLAKLANDDPVIKQLKLKPITRHTARNVMIPPKRRLKK